MTDTATSTANESLTEGRLFDVTSIPLKLGHVDSLAARFTLPPFTQLDGRSGWWQHRKQEWADLGLRSEEGRDARTFAKSAGSDEVSQKILAVSDGQSIFDPVLCEMAYRWFCPIGGAVLDPFAGGSVRGIVAGVLGRQYVGIDLSGPQVDANTDQLWQFQAAGHWPPGDHPDPTWIVGDSWELLYNGKFGGIDHVGGMFDFVWSCPPYHDLEQYSDDPRDLSNLDWREFKRRYRDIICASLDLLADDRFASFVVGEIRGPDGFYRHFVEETIDSFEAGGAAYYNEAFLVSPAGTLPLRAAKQFTVSRKLGRTHQSILVFCKGDPKAAAAACDPAAMAAFIGEAAPDDKDADYSGMAHG